MLTAIRVRFWLQMEAETQTRHSVSAASSAWAGGWETQFVAGKKSKQRLLVHHVRYTCVLITGRWLDVFICLSLAQISFTSLFTPSEQFLLHLSVLYIHSSLIWFRCFLLVCCRTPRIVSHIQTCDCSEIHKCYKFCSSQETRSHSIPKWSLRIVFRSYDMMQMEGRRTEDFILTKKNKKNSSQAGSPKNQEDNQETTAWIWQTETNKGAETLLEQQSKSASVNRWEWSWGLNRMGNRVKQKLNWDLD